MSETLRRVVGIGLLWGLLWLALMMIVGVIVGIANPDTIDAGEGWQAVLVLGPMGLFTGIAFALLLSLGAARSSGSSVMRAAGCGILATAIVQLAYLGHGDAGLVANLQMATLFSIVGGLVATMWLGVSRGWSQWRSSRQPAH